MYTFYGVHTHPSIPLPRTFLEIEVIIRYPCDDDLWIGCCYYYVELLPILFFLHSFLLFLVDILASAYATAVIIGVISGNDVLSIGRPRSYWLALVSLMIFL